MSSDADADGRYQTLEALPATEANLERFTSALQDASWRVRRLAAERLLELPPSQALIARLVALLGVRDDAGTRNSAAAVLAQLGPSVLPAVLSLLRGDDADRRRLAAGILGALGCAEVVPELLRCLQDADANVRAEAAEALGHLGGDDALRALLGLLDASDPLLRVCALEGLAEQGHAPPLPTLARLAKEAWTRPSAYRLLGRIEHPTARSLVCRALTARATRDAALAALAARGRLASADDDGDVGAALRALPDAVAWLSRALDAEAKERRVGALVAAHALGEPRLALSVARAARRDDEVALALAVLRRLGPRGAGCLLATKGAIAELPDIARTLVAEAVTELAEPSLVSPLAALLQSEDAQLAALATRALGRTRARAAIPLLMETLDDERRQEQAARSLVSLAASWPHEVREALEPRVRRRPLEAAVVRAWAEIVKSDAAALLLEASADAHEMVRAAAAEVAGCAPTVAPAVLEGALGDAAVPVRRAAARSLGRLESEEAEALIPRALADEDAQVLELAAGAAAERVARSATSALLRLTEHPVAAVVVAAMRALAALDELGDDVVAALTSRAEASIARELLALAAERPAIVLLAVRLLAEGPSELRADAAAVLEVSAAQEQRDALREMCAREPEGRVRRSLGRALARLASSP